MKLINYDINNLYELIKIYNKINEAQYDYDNMDKYECSPNYISFSTVRYYLNRVANIYIDMPDDFKEKYSNTYFNNLHLDIIESDIEGEINRVKNINESWAKVVKTYMTKIISQINAFNNTKINIDKAQICLGIILSLEDVYTNPKHLELCQYICNEAVKCLECMYEYILNMEIPEDKRRENK